MGAIVDKQALAECRQLNPRDRGAIEDKIRTGEAWPLLTHQFRRTFACFAVRNQLGHPIAIKQQFKHLSLRMSEWLFALGALESTAAVRIPETLAQFNQRYPRIQFALSTGPSGTMIDGVLEGTLSAAFVDGPLSHPELEGMPVYREEMMLVTPAGQAEISRAAQVSGSDVYAFRANCSYRRHLESWFHADRAAPGRIHEMESYHGMLACVIAGAGIALMPRSMLESMPGHHQVEAWPLAENWRWLTTWLVWRRGAMTRQLEAFIALLNERQPPAPSC